MQNRRSFLASCFTAPVLSYSTNQLLASHEGRSTIPWYKRCLVGMEVGPTGAQFGNSDPTDLRYAAKFDGAEIVKRCVAAGAQYLVMWVRDGDYAYYNSKILQKAPGLGNRDPLQEAIEQARQFSMPVIAYCVVQQAGHFLREHPEWEMRSPDGSPVGRFSLNSPYLQAMKDILTEQMAYNIAGFHIDMLDQGFGPPYGCWSEHARNAFQQQFGHPIPEMRGGPSWDAAWDEVLEFRYHTSQRFEQELAAHIRSINPDISVDFNYHGNPPFSWDVGQRPVQHAGHGDFVTGETGVWGFSALGVGLNAEFYRAATPGLPVQVAIQRGVRMYHDQTTRPTADMLWEMMTLASHGAFVTMVDKTAFDGSLDHIAYERFGQVFREVLGKSDHFGHAPIYDVGLYYSSRTRDWIGKENPGDWMQSFIGAHKALRYEQLQCGIVLDENATLESLQQYPAVVVCNAGILSTTEIELFSQYVQAGGTLIITGHSGQFDRLGQPIDRSTEEAAALESLIGATFVQRLDSLDNWMRFSESSSEDETRSAILPKSLPKDRSFLVKGPATVYRTTKAQAIGQLLAPERTTRQKQGKEGTDWPMSAGEVVGPAILINPLGKGQVITFGGSPDYATASEHHIVEARQLLSQAVRFADPVPRVRITAPSNVQSVVTEDRESKLLRVHLLGYNAAPQATPAKGRPHVLPALMEQPPIYRAVLNLADIPVAVEVLGPDTVLDWDERQISLTVNQVHEIVVIRLKN